MVEQVKKETVKKPDNWLSIDEVKKYVSSRYKRHWSSPYIYSLCRNGRLNSFDIGKVLLREDVDHLVLNLKRSGPPILKKAN